jgi:hypothetical protein
MNWKSFPSWTPVLVRRHAVLLVEWLRIANALKRWRSEWTSRSTVMAAAGIALVAASLATLSSRLVAAVDWLADYWILTALVTAVYAASSVSRRRRRVHELYLQSWLVAAPIPPASVRVSQAIRTLLPPIAQFLGVVLLFLAAASLAEAVLTTGKVLAAIASGLSIGMVVGWRAGAEQSKSRAPASNYVRAKQAQGKLHPGSQALSAWPISQVLAWSRPENARYILIVALFAVQGGSSAAVGLSVVALYFISSYLAALLWALTSVAKSASAWLRSTPMTLTEFAWVLSRRALIHQVLGTSLAAAFMLLLGAPLMPILQIAALWLSLVISVSGCVLADCYRGQSPVVKVALCFVAWSAVLAALQLRSAERV